MNKHKAMEIFLKNFKTKIKNNQKISTNNQLMIKMIK